MRRSGKKGPRATRDGRVQFPLVLLPILQVNPSMFACSSHACSFNLACLGRFCNSELSATIGQCADG